MASKNKKTMSNTYCPNCLYKNKISKVKLINFPEKLYRCKACKKEYLLPVILASEDVVRLYIKQHKGKLDYLLDELN